MNNLNIRNSWVVIFFDGQGNWFPQFDYELDDEVLMKDLLKNNQFPLIYHLKKHHINFN